MIEVHMRVHHQLHIFNAKTERLDVLDNLRRRLRQCTVNQHMASRGNDKDRTEPVRSHIVGVAENAKWFLGRVPDLALAARWGGLLVRDLGGNGRAPPPQPDQPRQTKALSAK